MHSPFVFDFIVRVLNNRYQYHPPAAIEKLRLQLNENNTLLEIEDLGAGSRVHASKTKSVRQIALTAVKPKKWSHFLFRLVQHYQPGIMIELGTSLGISTAYMAAAHQAAQVYTIEGSSAIQQMAQQHFAQLGLTNVHSLQGNFDNQLPPLLASLPHVDLAYIDGNHRYEPTIHYFEQLLTKKQNHTLFIFDDIHWSAEMEKAWDEIKAHPAVTLSIDLFFMGLVFFRQEFKVKQHFSIRF